MMCCTWRNMLLATLVAAAPVIATSSNLIAVYSDSLKYLDATGTELNSRNETMEPSGKLSKQRLHVTTNPHTGTVCWVTADQSRRYDVNLHTIGGQDRYPGVVRCAQLGNLNQLSELKMPRWLPVRKLKAIAYDWAGESWHLTAQDEWGRARRSYVCSSYFDQCLRLSETVDYGFHETFFAAYDISNQLLFRLGGSRLESVRLDGSGVRQLPVKVQVPKGLAVDSVGRHVFWVSDVLGGATELHRVDYDGSNLKRVEFPTGDNRPVAVDVAGAVVVWSRRQYLSVVSVVSGEGTDALTDSVNRDTVRQVVSNTNLLAVQAFTPETHADAKGSCSGGSCQDFCIPTVVNGTESATCFCKEGYEVAELECRKEYPGYAVVVGADSLQVVDLKTEEVSTILFNLTDATKVDFFWTGGEEFLLFWLDAGSLFRGRWSPGGPASDIQLLVPATETVSIVEVTVDWHQRNLLWLKIDSQHPSYGNAIMAEMSPLDGAFVGTIFVGAWEGQNQDIAVHAFGRFSVFVESGDPHWRQHRGKMRGGSLTCYPHGATGADIADIVIDTSMPEEENGELDRVVWIDRSNGSVGYSYHSFEFDKVLTPLYIGYSQLRHSSLVDAGGLDVLDGRLYWTHRTTGKLWTAHTETGGGDVRALPGVTGGRAVRLLHPRRQPPAPEQVCDDTGGGCSHFCLRVLTRRPCDSQQCFWEPLTLNEKWAPVVQCACPNGMRLDGDHKTCRQTTSDHADWLVDGKLQTMSCAEQIMAPSDWED